MATITHGKTVIDEITLDDEEEDEEMEEDYNDDTETKDFQVALNKLNGFQIEKGRGGSNGYLYENGEDEDGDMDYDEISQVNQPVDFIFAVEDDDGVETEIDTQKIFSSEPNEDKSLKHESPVKETTPVLNDLLKHQSKPAKQGQPIKTRSALRQQSNPQNGHPTPISIATPNTTSNKMQKKVKAPDSVDSIPVKQLRSSVREIRSIQNQSITQQGEPKSVNKKTINTPINTSNNTSTQPTPNEPKSANRKITNNSTINTNHLTSNGLTSSVTKNGKKSVNGIRGATSNTNCNPNRTATTSNVKKNGTSTINGNTGKTKQNVKTATEPPLTTTTTTITTTNSDKKGLTKKRTRAYWTGKEHIKLVGSEAPFVMIEQLPLFYSGQTEYKGHDCLKTICPAKRNLVKRKSPIPPPRIEPLMDNLSSTLNNVASDVPSKNNQDIPPVRPQIGQIIRFQFWQTPLGNNVPAKSSYQKAKVIGYDDEFDLYEIELFHYDHPFVITKDKTKNQRVTTNTMIIDWDSLADPSII